MKHLGVNLVPPKTKNLCFLKPSNKTKQYSHNLNVPCICLVISPVTKTNILLCYSWIHCSDSASPSRSWHIRLRLSYWTSFTHNDRVLSLLHSGVKAQMYDLSLAFPSSSCSSLFIPCLPLGSLCSPVGLPSCHTVLERVLNSVLSSCHPVFSSPIHPSVRPSSRSSLGSSVSGLWQGVVRAAGVWAHARVQVFVCVSQVEQLQMFPPLSPVSSSPRIGLAMIWGTVFLGGPFWQTLCARHVRAHSCGCDEWAGARRRSLGGLGSICLSVSCQCCQWLTTSSTHSTSLFITGRTSPAPSPSSPPLIPAHVVPAR